MVTQIGPRPPRRLDVLHRLEIRLSPCRHPSLVLDVPRLRSRRVHIRLPILAVRPRHSTIRLHAAHQVISSAMAGAGGPRDTLRGRYPLPVPDPGTRSSHVPTDRYRSQGCRARTQLKKVKADTNTAPSVPWRRT
ncbi:hypothetical protein CLOM_g6050 [Closterium sp. NIES-68]|nr:hypothetical protein CLOM_g6050 [Closterium sp. NIES-68]